eukprot:PLAT11951.1.p1 GENE.PLAT11951.1~~PLAT11951.1.p1  ORF type:complete len:718 (+),score=429.58 PLAT11951.1:119-2272(+)
MVDVLPDAPAMSWASIAAAGVEEGDGEPAARLQARIARALERGDEAALQALLEEADAARMAGGDGGASVRDASRGGGGGDGAPLWADGAEAEAAFPALSAAAFPPLSAAAALPAAAGVWAADHGQGQQADEQDAAAAAAAAEAADEAAALAAVAAMIAAEGGGGADVVVGGDAPAGGDAAVDAAGGDAAAAPMLALPGDDADPLSMEALAEEEAALYAGDAVDGDADLALALMLQEEEAAAAAAAAAAAGRRRGAKSARDTHVVLRSSVGLTFDLPERRVAALGDEDDVEEYDDPAEYYEMELEERVMERMERAGAGAHVTKHDLLIDGVKNAVAMEKDFEGSGDMSAHSIGGRAFNSAMRSMKKATRKGMVAHARVEASERSTKEKVLDSRTEMLLFRLLDAGVLEELHHVVRTGKESSVYRATAGDADVEGVGGADYAGRSLALKIYKTTLTEFKNRREYIEGDFRFRHLKLKKQNPRTVVRVWADKELRNMRRLYRAGVPCPEPLWRNGHIIAMSFIGKEHVAAPQLREVSMSLRRWAAAYRQAALIMKRMYATCNLVHADLSEYNLLYHKRVVYVIDVGQAVEHGHPSAEVFLTKDATNMTRFFSSRGVNVLPVEQLLAYVVDAELEEDDIDTLLADLPAVPEPEKETGPAFLSAEPLAKSEEDEHKDDDVDDDDDAAASAASASVDEVEVDVEVVEEGDDDAEAVIAAVLSG